MVCTIGKKCDKAAIKRPPTAGKATFLAISKIPFVYDVVLFISTANAFSDSFILKDSFAKLIFEVAFATILSFSCDLSNSYYYSSEEPVTVVVESSLSVLRLSKLNSKT